MPPFLNTSCVLYYRFLIFIAVYEQKKSCQCFAFAILDTAHSTHYFINSYRQLQDLFLRSTIRTDPIKYAISYSIKITALHIAFAIYNAVIFTSIDILNNIYFRIR